MLVNDEELIREIVFADRTITTERPAFVMGIVNATPDSFWQESRGAVDRALQLIDEGADILDVGGESTRPGAEYIAADEEIRRVIPVIQGIRKHSDIPISVDTRKSAVLRAALDAGADMLNDVSALEDDADMADLAARAHIPVILMHKRGIPRVMQQDTGYRDAFAEVNDYLKARADYALAHGIADNKIILDPGIGFGKDTGANCTLIRWCGTLCDGRYPVVMALSRKAIIGDLTGRDVADRLAGTITANVLAIIAGAAIIRVHDVKEAVDSMAVLGGIGYNY